MATWPLSESRDVIANEAGNNKRGEEEDEEEGANFLIPCLFGIHLNVASRREEARRQPLSATHLGDYENN